MESTRAKAQHHSTEVAPFYSGKWTLFAPGLTIRDVSFGALLADKAFDADWLLQDLDERGATAVIPPKSNRKVQRDYDTHMYKWRHLVENYFAKIKEFRGIATRYDKTDTSYAANWHLCATIIAAR